MPTLPAVDYVPTNEALVEQLGKFADALQETVNFGTHVLEWELEAIVGGDEHAPITLSTRHILELLDSVSINIRNSCVDPCKLLLRGALESLFGVLYILEDQSKRRAMAFMASYANQRLGIYKALDPKTDQGRAFQKAIDEDEIFRGRTFSIPPERVASSISNMEALLGQKEYRDAHAEFQRTKKTEKGRPYWYSLYGGPGNLEKLAEHLKLSAMYQVLYRQWSSAAHGTDIIQGKITGRSEGKAAVLQIRLPTDAQALTSLGISMGLKLYRAVLQRYASTRLVDLALWYTREIKSVANRLNAGQIIHLQL